MSRTHHRADDRPAINPAAPPRTDPVTPPPSLAAATHQIARPPATGKRGRRCAAIQCLPRSRSAAASNLRRAPRCGTPSPPHHTSEQPRPPAKNCCTRRQRGPRRRRRRPGFARSRPVAAAREGTGDGKPAGGDLGAPPGPRFSFLRTIERRVIFYLSNAKFTSLSEHILWIKTEQNLILYIFYF